MKAVLISIQPKWCELIASGKKTIEVRKTRPKIETPFKCYIYMTATKERCKFWEYITAYQNSKGEVLNGSQKVIGEFVCDEIIEDKRGENADVFSKFALLSLDEQKKYGGNKPLHGWHISDLKIYDKPKELGEFCAYCKKEKEEADEDCKGCSYVFKGTTTGEIYCDRVILRPPQSWQFVEELE